MIDDFSELENKLTDTAKASLERAGVVAHKMGSIYVGTEHLLMGVLAQNSSLGAKILADGGVTLDRVELALDLTPKSLVVVAVDKGLSQETVQTLRSAWMLAVEFGQSFIGTEHIVYSIIIQDRARATQLLDDMSIDIALLKSNLERMFDKQQQESLSSNVTQSQSKSLGVLNRYGVNLTDRALAKALDPVIGREKEIERMITILGRRSKSNPALIGEPGVGKTAVVEGLAQRIVDRTVPDYLIGKQVVQLDLMSMVAGTKYRGQFEERMQKVLQTLKKHPEIIVFVDELHLLVGAGGVEGSMDAANTLKPALARGEIRMVGATTLDEYRKHIEKDAALSRRFQTIVVDEPTTDETVEIVRGLSSRLSLHHGVGVSDKILKLAVDLAERYVPDRRLPDKAIDVIDEAAALLRSEKPSQHSKLTRIQSQIRLITRKVDLAVENQDYERAASLKADMVRLEQQAAGLERISRKPALTEKYLRRAVAAISGVPLANVDSSKSNSLARLEARLKIQVVGQDGIVDEIVRVIKRARSGLAPSRRPLGSFVFLGPTGVGKTELARVLAREVFGGDKSLIKIDMSELSEKHTAARLVGAPAGYVGYDDGGKLTDAVRSRPYSVVLFDEVEKAHPEVLNLLLQLLEDGQLTDARGRIVSFRQTIIILTSNVGAEKMFRESELGFGPRSAKTDRRLADMHERNSREALRELEKFMRPELLSRFDNVMTFQPLTRSAVGKIFDNIVAEFEKGVIQQGFELKITPSVKRFIIREGYDEQRGARPLRREIERRLFGAVADVMVASGAQTRGLLEARMRSGEVVVNVTSA